MKKHFYHLWREDPLLKVVFLGGGDVGLKDFAILSDGTVFKNPTFFRSLEQKLAKEQRILARRKQGAIQRKQPLAEAKNYQKQILMLIFLVAGCAIEKILLH
ncbi:hypothetical protein [Domibacillus enclensis]|uniref:Uncharacterized protein n=1 Tax=Domibacillus enclensis TaxID=1017273 RepID=A0A1N6ZA39_9BACI|nr:hypothetical protein SAMN05443094_106151 [Domibacillus enclensis]